VTLKYLSPATAKEALIPLLSSKGNLVILQKENQAGQSGPYIPNKLHIVDLPSSVEQMLRVIDEMDKPERMISITVKIIENQIDSNSKLGLSWPTALSTSLGGGSITETSSESDGSSSASESTALDGVLGNYNPNSGNWVWGTLSIAEVQVVLDLLETSGNSKLLSDPHITTLENHEAVIKIETIIPIPTVSRFTEGAATQDIQTFYDEEVGISLVVTPRISEDNMITLDVAPKIEDIIGFTGSQDAQKPITISRSVRTRITVANGETAILGGLLKENLIEKEQKVPLLGSIPLLGKLLFTSKSEEKTTTDLIILITPRILP